MALGGAVVAIALGTLAAGVIVQLTPHTAAKSPPFELAGSASSLQEGPVSPVAEGVAASAAPQAEQSASGWQQAVVDPSAQPVPPPPNGQQDASATPQPEWLLVGLATGRGRFRRCGQSTPAPGSQQETMPGSSGLSRRQRRETSLPQAQLSCAKNAPNLASLSVRSGGAAIRGGRMCAQAEGQFQGECVNCPVMVVVLAGHASIWERRKAPKKSFASAPGDYFAAARRRPVCRSDVR